jgi:hypothetical protein
MRCSSRTRAAGGSFGRTLAWLTALLCGLSVCAAGHAQQEGSASPGSAAAPMVGQELPPEEGLPADEVLLAAQEAIATGDFGRARQLLESGAVDEADRLALSGFVALLEGDCQRALLEFRQVLTLRPSREGVWLYVAQCELIEGDALAAHESWARGVGTGRELADVWLLGAQIELAAGHTGESWRIAGEADGRFEGDGRFRQHRQMLAQQLGLRWAPEVWQLVPLQPSVAPWDLAWRLHGRVQGVRPGAGSAPALAWGVTGGAESAGDRIQRLVETGEFTRALALGAGAGVQPSVEVCDALTRAALEVGDRPGVSRWLECASSAWREVARGWLDR